VYVHVQVEAAARLAIEHSQPRAKFNRFCKKFRETAKVEIIGEDLSISDAFCASRGLFE
jgi:hypothetical protein